MRLSDFLCDVGRPVAYYPKLADILGGVKQGILVCQLLYWTDKTRDGWIYKESKQLQSETGLSYEEQKVARGYLDKLGVLESRYNRLSHKIGFRVNIDRLNQLWDERMGIGVNPDGQKAEENGDIGANLDGIAVNPDREQGKASLAIGANPDRRLTDKKIISEKNISGEGGEAASRPAAPPIAHGSAGPLGFEDSAWEQDADLREFLLTQKLVALPLEYFSDNAWWTNASIGCHGISVKFLERVFAALGNKIKERPQSRPMNRAGWLKKMTNFLRIEREIVNREEANAARANRSPERRYAYGH